MYDLRNYTRRGLTIRDSIKKKNMLVIALCFLLLLMLIPVSFSLSPLPHNNLLSVPRTNRKVQNVRPVSRTMTKMQDENILPSPELVYRANDERIIEPMNLSLFTEPEGNSEPQPIHHDDYREKKLHFKLDVLPSDLQLDNQTHTHQPIEKQPVDNWLNRELTRQHPTYKQDKFLRNQPCVCVPGSITYNPAHKQILMICSSPWMDGTYHKNADLIKATCAQWNPYQVTSVNGFIIDQPPNPVQGIVNHYVCKIMTFFEDPRSLQQYDGIFFLGCNQLTWLVGQETPNRIQQFANRLKDDGKLYVIEHDGLFIPVEEMPGTESDIQEIRGIFNTHFQFDHHGKYYQKRPS